MEQGKEQRNMRAIVGPAGGNTGKNTVLFKVSIPSAWAREMGISKEDRDLLMTFDGEKILIEKKKN